MLYIQTWKSRRAAFIRIDISTLCGKREKLRYSYPHVITFCVHTAIMPLLFTQLFEGTVSWVEGEQFGQMWLAKGLAQLHQCSTQV